MALQIKTKPKAPPAGPRGGLSGKEVSTGRPRYVAKVPPCQYTCPSSEDIRGYLTAIAQGDQYQRTMDQSLTLAWQVLTDKNPIPATMGRVCPHPCQAGCNRREHDSSVGINSVEHFIGDFGIEKGLKLVKLTDQIRPEKVAVVGSGPAGLSAAYQLARRGYQVTIFEAFAETGGMLRYGIPSYRLPRAVLDAEVQRILDLGVTLRLNTKVGVDLSFAQLQSDYQAVFLGNGCHRGKKLDIEGEDAPNVFTGASYLNRVNGGAQVDLGDQVLVIGGGDSAVDAARVASRLGASVTILYRRTREEMPAIKKDVNEAIEEGIGLELLTAPKQILLENGRAKGLLCFRMALGEPDASGRRRPVPVEGSEFTIACDSIIAAVSQEPELEGFPEVANQWGWIDIDKNGRTSVAGVFAGGDVINISLVTTAVGQGRVAAEAIDRTLRREELLEPVAPRVVYYKEMKIAATYYPKVPRQKRGHLPATLRMGNFNPYLVPLIQEEMVSEAKRCMSCGMCFDCENCYIYCSDGAVIKLPKGQHFKYDLDKCTGCDKCFNQCPCGYIDWVG